MSNAALLREQREEYVLNQLNDWKRRHLSYYKQGFARTLEIGDKRIRCMSSNPGDGKFGFVLMGPFNTELGSIYWNLRGETRGFSVNEAGCRRVKAKLDSINKKIDKEMREWLDENLEYMKSHLAKLCGCNKKDITIERIVPGYNFNDNCSIIFRGPQIEGRDNYLGDVQWDQNGNFLDFEPDDENIMEIRRFYKTREKAIMERARNKSVNRTVEQQKEREISLGKELVGFITSHVKEIAVTAAIFIALTSSVNFFKAELNPDYINDAYNAGYHAVSVETHRTQDNQNYWYDYHDIAARYDESYDFDSWVYGTYKNVGWNEESRLDCMDEVFDALEDRGITAYDSFLEYCEAKGVCKEKNGKTVIDTKEYRELVEDYMRSINGGSLENTDEKKSGFRI